MKLTYETGTATLIQFIVLSLLNIANGINASIDACREGFGGCIGDLAATSVLYLFIVGWFAFIWVLGYAAQDRRSKKLALALILAELAIAFFAFVNIRHRNDGDYLGLITSVVDLVLAVLVIVLATRLVRADGARIVHRQRSRRKTPSNT